MSRVIDRWRERTSRRGRIVLAVGFVLGAAGLIARGVHGEPTSGWLWWSPWIGIFVMYIGNIISSVDASRRRKRLQPKPFVPLWAPPGYYPDPAGEPVQRWWDGYSWTRFTAPLAS